MERNFEMIFYGPKERSWALVAPGGSPEDGTTQQGAPRGPGAPWWGVPTSGAPGPPLCSINTPKYQNPRRVDEIFIQPP